jgi:hypothetical protein
MYKSILPSTTWDYVNQREIDENAVIFVDNVDNLMIILGECMIQL